MEMFSHLKHLISRTLKPFRTEDLFSTAHELQEIPRLPGRLAGQVWSVGSDDRRGTESDGNSSLRSSTG